jgi:hypothetical protein
MIRTIDVAMTSPTLEQPPALDRRRIPLTATQVVASALAAITATVAASLLGVAGTVIGAALASVVTVTGNAVYSHSLQRFRPRTLAPSPLPAAAAPRRPGWAVLAAACLGVFAAVLFVVTAVEVVAGRPLSDVVRGKSGSGTSLLGDSTEREHPPTPTVTVTITPKVVTSTPTVTITGAPATQTVTPSPTETATPSGTATQTPSGSAAPSDAPSAG